MKPKWKAFFEFFGISTVQTAAEGIFLKEEEVDKIQAAHVEYQQKKAEYEAAQTALATAKTEKENAEAALATANTELTTAKTTIRTQATEISGLKAKLSAKPAEETTIVDDAGATAKKKEKYSWTEKHIVNKGQTQQ